MTLKKLTESKYHISTQLLYGESKSKDWDYGYHVVPPMSATSTFRLDSAARGAEGFNVVGDVEHLEKNPPIYIYNRMSEPTINMLEHALAVAEDGEVGLVFASGMAAVHAATFAFLESGAEIVSHKTIYGCSYSLFTNIYPKFGIKTHFTDLGTADNLDSLINSKTRLVYLESPANPTLELIDIKKITNKIKEHNKSRKTEDKIISVIDNTFATPWCQRPMKHGVDVVLHSLTKNLSGFGTEVGGAIITKKEFYSKIFGVRKDCGGVMSSRTAWHTLIYGISTLEMRVKRQQETAQKVAEFLESHPKIDFVRYPGLKSYPQQELAKQYLIDPEGNFAPGNMIFFALKAPDFVAARAKGEQMINFVADNSYSITLAVSLGQVRTLIEHPGSMTHSSYSVEEQVKRGMHPGGIRISIGIENYRDIVNDLAAALDGV